MHSFVRELIGDATVEGSDQSVVCSKLALLCISSQSYQSDPNNVVSFVSEFNSVPSTNPSGNKMTKKLDSALKATLSSASIKSFMSLCTGAGTDWVEIALSFIRSVIAVSIQRCSDGTRSCCVL